MEIVQQKILELLKKIGFTEYEASAYSVIASIGSLTAVDVADMSTIPRPKIYSVLEKLKERGFVTEKKGKTTEYTAIPPSELKEKIKKEENRKDAAVKLAGEKLMETMAEKNSKIISGDGIAYTIKGQENMAEKLEEMLDRGKKASILTSHDHSLVLRRPALRCKLEEMQTRAITDESIDETGGLYAKVYPVREKFGLIVIDGEECLMGTVEGESTEYNAGVYIKDSVICRGIQQAYDFMWEMI